MGNIKLITLMKPKIRIAESGIKVGNLDRRFSSLAELKANREYFFDGAGLNEQDVICMDALGGDTFVDLDSIVTPERVIATDAFVTTRKNVGLALFPADCIPLVLHDTTNGVLALVHLGWRGCVARLHSTVLNHMEQQHGTKIADMRCYLGPSIHQASYIMPKIHLSQQIEQWSRHIKRVETGFAIDLRGYVIEDLEQMGVEPEHIYRSLQDTADPSQELFSNYRAQRINTDEKQGRNGFLVWLADTAS